MRILNMMSIPLLILVTGSLVASPSPQGPAALQSPAAEHQHPLSPDALTGLPQRPDWMPLPILFGKTSELDSLTRLVKSPDPKIRAKTAFILGQMSSPRSIVSLRGLLADNDRSVRPYAGLALGYMGDASGLKTCARVLAGRFPEWMKYYAICGLWRIHTVEAMRVLRKASIGNSALLRSARRGALQTNRAK
ncbi:MAG TPA: HEAT repeat domain-containing protein, partial [Armatimonadota bacterium]